MENLLKIAAAQADQAEVYTTSYSNDGLSFVDGNLKDADSSLSSGIALRVIKNGRIGLAHTRNLLDPEKLLQQALFSAANGQEVGFSFPKTASVASLKTYDPEIEKTDKQKIVTELKQIVDYVKKQSDLQLDLGAGYYNGERRIINSAGTDLSEKSSEYYSYASITFPGSASSIFHITKAKKYQPLDMAEIDKLIELYRLGQNEVIPPTAKMSVIFTPRMMYALLTRFYAAIAPVNFYNKISPLLGKFDQQVFSPKLTISQNPFNDTNPGAAGFDDEGTPTQKAVFVQNGVFKSIYTDLNYASKLNLPLTGNGWRDSEASPVGVGSNHLHIQTGDQSIEQMIAGIERGIIVYDLLGAHSGNVLNGDFSVGVSTGFYVENGKITGRVKDCMLSGNIYETFNNILAIENKAECSGRSSIPSILFGNVSVAGK